MNGMDKEVRYLVGESDKITLSTKVFEKEKDYLLNPVESVNGQIEPRNNYYNN